MTMVEAHSRKRWRAELTSSKDRRSAKKSFRLNPTFACKGTNKLSLLGRRKDTNGIAIENSSSATLFPTSSNTIDLVTPEDFSPPPKMGSMPPTTMDSAYYSAPSSVTKHSLSPERPDPPSIAPIPSKKSPALPGITSSVSEYRSTMRKRLDSQFFNKVLKKQYKFPAKARASLEPIMRMVLQKPEDRPIVPKNYLILDLKNSRIRGETRMVRKPPRKSGQRRTDGPTEEMTWYFGPKVGYH